MCQNLHYPKIEIFASPLSIKQQISRRTFTSRRARRKLIASLRSASEIPQRERVRGEGLMKLAAAINRRRISAERTHAYPFNRTRCKNIPKAKRRESDFSFRRERFLIFRLRAPLIRAPALGNQEEYKCDASAPEMPKAMQRERKSECARPIHTKYTPNPTTLRWFVTSIFQNLIMPNKCNFGSQILI